MMNQNKISVGILGATGMVGQRFVRLLADHPWFVVTCVAASERSAGQAYADAVEGRWLYRDPIPEHVASLTVHNAVADMESVADQADFVFSAMSMDKETIREVETAYASLETPVVSNNSAHRWTEDVPVFIPEINPHHAELIDIQRENRGWSKGFLTAKPNCSIQSYVPVIEALREYQPEKAAVSTYQAISGAGKTFDTYPEIADNIIPYIGGEEQKSEDEPGKIWGEIKDGELVLATTPVISSTCVRVPVTDGHLVTVHLTLGKDATREELIEAIQSYKSPLDTMGLPSSPDRLLTYFAEADRPQTRLDRDMNGGMGIAVGRLREDPVLGWKFVALSHNTIRGAAGGAILTAEMLVKKGYIPGGGE